MKYECPCGYIYDETLGDVDNSIPAGTKWDKLPKDFTCPICGLSKEEFNRVE